MAKPKRTFLTYPRICSVLGCNTIVLKRRPMCPSHFSRWRHATYDHRYAKRDRARRLAVWLTRDKFPRKKGTPLTRAEQRIYMAELNRLLALYPPKTQMASCWLAARASHWARGGGRKAYQHRTGIAARVAGWRRKWLREGSYDLVVLEQTLAEIRKAREKRVDKPAPGKRVSRKKED